MRQLLICLMIQLPIWCAGQLCTPRCGHAHGRPLKSLNDYFSPENLRSDTIDVLNYLIDLDMTQMGSGQISASCTVSFESKMDDVDLLHLDLLGLTVDEVTSPDGTLSFTHAGSDLFIQLPEALNTGDAYEVTVHYHGDPQTDPTWGGFYTSTPGFAYNIGVGFTSDPHNLGRVWFPCFDNFVERSTFDVRVLTSQGRTAYCGGIRVSQEVVGQDSLYTRWVLDNPPIPSYLASVAVSNYTHVDQEYTTALGETIPVWLAARPQDTTAMKNSFANLLECMAGFEEHYGPYRWSRVGFVSVPFSAGAMEHATNIAYPSLAINGNLVFEPLIAHELSHQWWGDLVTCRTAEDMWLNEGWATYSESLFEEFLYGEEAYRDYVADNHKDVLTDAHIEDGGRYPVSGVPHELTYSNHVYLKGADVIHTLRGYMGDDAFFEACRDYIEAFQAKDASSEDLRDFFQQYTDKDLNSFFDNWIFEPGFPEFRVEDQDAVQQGDTWTTDLSVRQYRHYSTEYYTQVPMEITLMDDQYHTSVHQVILSGEWTNVSLVSAVEPVHVILNRSQALNYAVLAEERFVTDDGSENFQYAEMDLDFNSLGSADSIWMRVENHWAAGQEPHVIPYTDFIISSDRWWLVQTDAPQDASIDATIRYFGDEDGANFFDPLFFEEIDAIPLINETDLIMLYRPDGQSAWTEWPSYTVNTQGNSGNWSGRIELTGIRAGQYAWGIRTGTVGVEDIATSDPSPMRIAWIQGDLMGVRTPGEGMLHVTDALGKTVFSGYSGGLAEIHTGNWSAGVYLLKHGNSLLRWVKE